MKTGDEVALEVDGPEADRVADELQALLEQDSTPPDPIA